MAQDIVVRYRAEVDDLLRKLDQVSDAQKEVIQGEKQANDEAKKATTTQAFAATKRNQLLELEKKKLAELQKAQKLAFDPKQIDAYNSKIAESNRNIELLTDNTKKQTSIAGGALKSFALGAGAALAAAFSVGAIVNFSKVAVNGFLEAEKASDRLRFSIITLGGNSEAAFQRLEQQAEALERSFAIDADNIKEAQGALAAFGLTADEIEKAIPKLADFATVAGIDIVSAVQQVGAGLEGAGREFKKYGIEVSATASRQENLNSILEGFDKFAGAAENSAQTLTGTLEGARLQANALSDQIGKVLAPAFVKAKLTFLEFASAAVQGFRQIFDAAGLRNERLTNIVESRLELTRAEVEGTFNSLIQSGLAEQEALDKAIEIVEKRLKESRFKVAPGSDEFNLLSRELKALEDISNEISNRIKLEKEKQIAIDNANELKRLQELALAQKKVAQERLDEINRLRDEIEKDAKEVTALEKSELDKRDTAYLDSIEKRRKALQELADAEKDRAAQAEQIQFDAQIEALLNEELSVRQTFADTFKELTLEDLELKKKAIREELGFSEDANNQIVILEKQTNDALKKLYESLGLTFKATSESNKENWVSSNAEILQSTSQLLGEISSVYTAFTNRQIEEINREKDARISAINESLRQNEDALEKRQISEQDAAANEKRLIEQQTRAEETAARKERDLKRKQAIADKAAALVQIAINTAIGISRAYSDTGPIAGNAFAALIAALGAAQAATVAAQPIPYAKGTKKAKGGLARVGEEGEEIMFVPNGTKVLPNKQTNRYGEVLDAMFDNRFDEYVNRRYIAPALMKEKARRETNQQRSFAENIVQSAMVNPQTGLTYYDMEQIRKKGTRLTDDTIERLADALNRRTGTTRFK